LVEAGILRRGFADAALECAAEECGLVRDDGLASVHATIDSGLRRIPAKLADRAT
jgi:putative DNA primase/helicase